MAEQAVPWTVIAATPPGEGPFQVQIGFAIAPEDSPHRGKWFAVTRSLEFDGTPRKIVKAGPFDTPALAEKAARDIAHDFKKEGVPIAFFGEDGACTCPFCTVREWRKWSHSVSRVFQLIGVACFLVSLTSGDSWASWFLSEVGAVLIWFGVGAAWASYSVLKKVNHVSRAS